MDWDSFISREREKEYFKKLQIFLEEERNQYEIYPKEEDVFNAFKYTPFEKTKVVILAQDPYIKEKQAIGIAFATGDGKIAPSLKNIYKEIEDDLKIDTSEYTCDHPISWAKQGVFMLNTTLTVRKGESNSHQGKGWSKFTDAAISELDKDNSPKVFLLWGNYAKKISGCIHNPNHLILTAAHPSPLSANRGFFGCKHFSNTNNFLTKNNLTPINW